MLLINPYRFAGGPPPAAVEWDPTRKGSAVTLSGGNLSAAVNTAQCVAANAAKSSGKWYWEVLIGSQASTYGYIGLVDIATQNYNATIDGSGVSYRSTGSMAGGSGGAGWAPGDVAGFELNLTGGVGSLQINVNGAPSASKGIALGPSFAPACSDDYGSPAFVHNFILRADPGSWTYSAPSGFNPL